MVWQSNFTKALESLCQIGWVWYCSVIAQQRNLIHALLDRFDLKVYQISRMISDDHVLDIPDYDSFFWRSKCGVVYVMNSTELFPVQKPLRMKSLHRLIVKPWQIILVLVYPVFLEDETFTGVDGHIDLLASGPLLFTFNLSIAPTLSGPRSVDHWLLAVCVVHVFDWLITTNIGRANKQTSAKITLAALK